MLEGEVRSVGAFVDFAVGEGGAVLIPLIAVFQGGIFGNSAGLNGYGLLKVVVNRAAEGELNSGLLDFALLEQLVVSRLGDRGSFADGSIGHVALRVNEVPAEVLHAVNEAGGKLSSVGFAVGHGDGSAGFAAVAVKGNGVGVGFPHSVEIYGFVTPYSAKAYHVSGLIAVAGAVSLGVPACKAIVGAIEPNVAVRKNIKVGGV